MHIEALCCREFAESTRRAAGVEPMLPPFPALHIGPGGLVYIDLHGEDGADCWRCGDGMTPFGVPVRRAVVLTAEEVRRWTLRGAVVFTTACYAADNWNRWNPMVRALLAAGASCVVAGSGPNLAGRTRPAGAALLGLWLRRGLEVGLSVEQALGLARQWLRLVGGPAAADARGFRVVRTADGG